MLWYNSSRSLLLSQKQVKDQGRLEKSRSATGRIKLLEDRTRQGLNPACFSRYITLFPNPTSLVHHEDPSRKAHSAAWLPTQMFFLISQTHNYRGGESSLSFESQIKPKTAIRKLTLNEETPSMSVIVECPNFFWNQVCSCSFTSIKLTNHLKILQQKFWNECTTAVLSLWVIFFFIALC